LITDVYQIPALLAPATIQFAGKIPEAYLWSQDVLAKLGMKTIIAIP
jgi:hypothetical protein